MKFKSWFALLFSFLLTYGFAQIKDPVKLKYDVKPLSNGEYEAVLTATLESGWHIYSKDLPEDSGIPTEMILSGDNIQKIGKVVEVGKKHDEFSEAFGVQIVYYSNQVLFKQKFKLKDPAKPGNAVAEITYQTCNDRVCLAPNTLEFEKAVTPVAAKKEETPTATEIPKDEETTVEKTDTTLTKTAVENIAPVETNIDTNINKTNSLDPKNLKISSLDFKNPLTDCGMESKKNDSSYWMILILGFLSGIIALLTPCVYPMIPLTISFFIKGNHNRKKGVISAALYGFFIFAIFTLLSLPFHLINGISGNILNEISTNIWLNIIFFIVFFIFALSFFGYFEITLPNSWINKASKAEEAGGIAGIFFMALTLVLVSFSCTGPILGSTLGNIISGGENVAMILTFALAGFGLAWAIVFGLLALFPQALQSLPKSGGWMNTVKVVLGFIELGLALKFLSKADLVSKTFFLKRELFIALWILITLGLVLYLFGLIRFPHDDKKPKISLTRKILGVLGIGFMVYLVQGLFPSERPKLQLLSGILPPLNVSYLHNEKEWNPWDASGTRFL